MIIEEVKKEIEQHPEWNQDDSYLSQVLYRLGLKETNCTQKGLYQFLDVYQILFLESWSKERSMLPDALYLVRLYERVAAMEGVVTVDEKSLLMKDLSLFFGIGFGATWETCDLSKYQRYVLLEKECEQIAFNYKHSEWYRKERLDVGLEMERQYHKWNREFPGRLLSVASMEKKSVKQKIKKQVR